MNGYHKSAVLLKTPIKKVNYDTIHKRIQRTGNLRYTKEFREQAILLSDEIGVKKAAEQLGIIYSTLADWRKRRSDIKKSNNTAESAEPLTEREKQLIKEIAELKEANEILKDAMSFFVKDRRK